MFLEMLPFAVLINESLEVIGEDWKAYWKQVSRPTLETEDTSDWAFQSLLTQL